MDYVMKAMILTFCWEPGAGRKLDKVTRVGLSFEAILMKS